MTKPMSARHRFVVVPLLGVMVAGGLGAVTASAQISAYPSMSVSATQDQATALSAMTYVASHSQNWINPVYGQVADLPASVDFYSLETGTVTAPISSTVYNPTGPNYFGYTISGDWGAGVQFSVRLGPSALATHTVSSTYRGGVLDGTVSTVELISESLPDLPLFSSMVFDTFTGGNVLGGDMVSVDFSNFAVPGLATGASRSFGLNRLAGPSSTFLNIMNQILPSGATSHAVDTGLLVAETPYLFYLSDSYMLNGAQYQASISLQFTTIPEPATYGMIVGLLAATGLVLRRRRFERQQLWTGQDSVAGELILPCRFPAPALRA